MQVRRKKARVNQCEQMPGNSFPYSEMDQLVPTERKDCHFIFVGDNYDYLISKINSDPDII